MSEGEVVVTTKEFEPGSIEDFAMQKVTDLDKERDSLLRHSTFLRNIESVLRRGAYSEDFAKRIKDESYRKNFKEHYNRKHVSLSKGELGVWIWGDVLILIDSSKVKSISNVARLDNEQLAKLRVKPSSFLGLQLIHSSSIYPLLPVAREVWKDNPENALPIYGALFSSNSDELLWPRRMTYKEIVAMLAERKK